MPGSPLLPLPSKPTRTPDPKMNMVFSFRPLKAEKAPKVSHLSLSLSLFYPVLIVLLGRWELASLSSRSALRL